MRNMPAASPAQHRPMEAAAHTDAAGVAFLADGKILLGKRADTGEWALPAGHVEPGETPEQAARREVLEETGYRVAGNLRQLGAHAHGDLSFTTFGQAVARFDPVLNDEHTEHAWAPLDALPEPLHPGVALLAQSGALGAIDPRKMTELDVARQIAAGELPSPQRFGAMALFALRVTGTGMAYRRGIEEFAYRAPELYLNDEFLARCNGLAVILEHPDKSVLNSEEFAARAIGAILLPYIQTNEVWGIAKIYDAPAIRVMTEQQMSTSPAVVFRDPGANSTVELEDGKKLLIEGVPSLLDHLAICVQGVWDKGGEPTGVLLNNDEAKMTDDEIAAKAKADADKEAEEAKAKADSADTMKTIMDAVGALVKRMDSFEAVKKADSEEDKEAEKKEAEAKADADFNARVDAAVAARLPRVASDADVAALAAAQAKADRVAGAFGKSAPRPLQGETLLAYRKRLLSDYKAHSAAWTNVDLALCDSAVLDVAEGQVYADAMTAAANPVVMPGEGLREIRSTSAAGHSVSTYKGNPGAWTGQFKLPMRHVSKFNKEA